MRGAESREDRMRSYHSHVETLLNGPKPPISKKPCFRSSAVFPVIQKKHLSSRILFMGYWKVKRNLSPISCVATLRTQEGTLVTRHSLTIEDHRCYRIELNELLEKSGAGGCEFLGSLEVEFFAAQDIFFPFPAAVLNYYGEGFSSVVHTAQRVYNDFDDMRENSLTTVPESGFNLHCHGETTPFFSLINGPEQRENFSLRMELFNHKKERLEKELTFSHLAPYETLWVYPAEHVELETFLDGEVGCAKIHFDLSWIYPRLIVGNWHPSSEAVSVTHSYYDCSEARSTGDYWHKAIEGWHPANLAVPVTTGEGQYTHAYFYPIVSPSKLAVHVEIYAPSGELLGKKEHVLSIVSPCQGSSRIPFKEICEELGITGHPYLSGRILAEPEKGGRLPARLKLGLDLGEESKGLPCNVCTNLHPFNPSMERKPSCFRWGPVLADQGKGSVWVMNSSPSVDYQRGATVNMVFYREEDTQTLSRQYHLPAHGFFRLSPQEDTELEAFLGQKVGWFTARSDNPYITTYYFSHSHLGVVGGDHGF